MNKIKKIFTIFLLFFLIFLLFKYNYTLERTIMDAYSLWLHKVFPSLFIMFIISDIVVNLDLLDPFTKYFNKLFNKIFNTSSKSGEIFLLSILCGTPASTYIIIKMYKLQRISLDDANKLMAYTYFSNPLFLYNILSLSFNKTITIKIIIIHYISNLIIGLLIRKGNNIENEYNNIEIKVNLLETIPQAIKNSINTLLIILGTISFYMIITNLIITTFNLNHLNIALLKGLLEITQFLNYIPRLQYISILKEILAISFISFGGLSIHTQVLALLDDKKIKYQNFFMGRVLHSIISVLLYLVVYAGQLFPK